MSFVTPEIAIRHCRIDDDEERDLIVIYLAAAEDSCAAYLNRLVFKDEAELNNAIANNQADENAIVANSAIIAAALLILGHLYKNRESSVIGATAQELPFGAMDLLKPFRLVNKL